MKKIFTLCFVVAILLSTSAFSQDFFFRIDGIEGEVTTVRHEKQIQVESYSQAIASCVPTNTGGGAGACKVTISPLSLLIKFDKSNIALKNAVLNGKAIASADFYARKTGGDGNPYAYYQIRLENVTIISSQESGSNGSGTLPSVAVEISCTRIAWVYRAQNSDGTAITTGTTGWDTSANKPWTYAF